MKVEDYFTEGRREWFRPHEKVGKQPEVPVHYNAESCVDPVSRPPTSSGGTKILSSAALIRTAR